MRIFYDTNVILDLLANRPGFAKVAAQSISVSEDEGNFGFMSALTVCDIVYIMRKSMSADEVGKHIAALEDILQIADVTRAHVMTAFGCGMSDYEDAVQSHCAESIGADVIVTRNADDFVGASICVMTPDDFLKNGLAADEGPELTT